MPAYFIVPVIFTVFGYGVLRVALAPVWQLGMAYVSLVVADDAPNFNPELQSIYYPNAEKLSEKNKVISIEDINLPSGGEHYGQLVCERIGLDSPVYWGDTNAILRSGAGHSQISFLPGFGRVMIICAHNTTFFKPLQNVEEGDIITFDTNYETYQYKVTNVTVMNENDLGNKMDSMLLEEKETLLLYTCYPFHAISGRKTDRLVVFGDRIEGRDVKWKEE